MDEETNVVPFPKRPGPWAFLGPEWRDVQPTPPVLIPFDDVETARMLEVAGRAGKLAFQYEVLLRIYKQRSGDAQDDGGSDAQQEQCAGTDVDDMRDDLMNQLTRMWRTEWSEAEFDRHLTGVWHTAHDWAQGCERIFAAETNPITVVSD